MPPGREELQRRLLAKLCKYFTRRGEREDLPILENYLKSLAAAYPCASEVEWFVYINKRKTSWVCFVNDFYGIEVIWGSIKVVHIHQPSKLSQMEITACVVMLTAHITLNITQYYPRLSNITPNITPILLTLHFF